MSERHIVIVGAGIGGLTACLALLTAGIDATVYDRTVTLGEVGAGLHVSPNGSRVLGILGLGPRLAAASGQSARERVMRLWSTGEAWTIAGQTADAVDRYGAPYLLLHRADLHTALVDAVRSMKSDAIVLGAEYLEFTQDTASVAVSFANGAVAHGDALVAADGIRSRAREVLYGSSSPSYTGFIYWRGLIPMERVPATSRGVSAGWVGPENYITTYPVRSGELLNFNGSAKRESWETESWTEEGTTAEIAADFAGWHPDIQEIVRNIEHPFRWGSFLRPPLPHWSQGRVTLLGDACHPMTASLGQGANMAIEDGLILARCLESRPDDVIGALGRYEELRVPRTTRVIQASAATRDKRLSRRLTDPVSASGEMDRMWAPDVVARAYDWIFGFDASDIPV